MRFPDPYHRDKYQRVHNLITRHGSPGPGNFCFPGTFRVGGLEICRIRGFP